MNCDKNFKKGLLVGGVVGGLIVGLGMSKKGREMQQKAVEYSQELCKELRNKMIEWGEISKDMYKDLAHRAVEELGKRKEMAVGMKDMVVDRLEDKWDEVQNDLLYRKVKHTFEGLTEKTRHEYERIVQDLVEDYASKKDLGAMMKYKLVRELKKKWEDMKPEKQENLKGWL